MKLRTLALAALALSLCGCFAARYDYSRTAAGDVQLTIRSNRDLPAGFVGSIGADGSLTSNVGAATGGQTSVADVAQILAIAAALAKPTIPALPAPAATVEPKP